MPNREKVIIALECRTFGNDFPCSKCDYYREDENIAPKCDYHRLMVDTIALLKDQCADGEKKVDDA